MTSNPNDPVPPFPCKNIHTNRISHVTQSLKRLKINKQMENPRIYDLESICPRAPLSYSDTSPHPTISPSKAGVVCRRAAAWAWGSLAPCSSLSLARCRDR